MVVKEFWDNEKLNGIFWLGKNISILAHQYGFLKLEKTKDCYGKNLKETSKLLDVPIEDLRDIRRRIEDENRS